VKPILFIKPPTSACGPYDTIRVPHVAQDDMVDYEAELAVVIGKKCRDVTKEQALNYVAGKKKKMFFKILDNAAQVISVPHTYLTPQDTPFVMT
jgi:Fumarylacetoacetate (FAA) hydrolase family